ncbi:MAG: calcium/sodium antiporter [Rikenellaceae bacterium]
MDALFLLLGLALILGGANYLTDGAAAVAKRFNISEFVVGLTIVAIGTSMPEMVVSLLSALEGNGDIAVGNVVGSNIFNTFAILGVCALVRPMELTKENIRKDIPMGILASMIFIMVTYSGKINNLHGIVMTLIWFALMFYTIKSSKKSFIPEEHDDSEGQISPLLSILFIVGGLGALIGGGQLFLDSAVKIAESFNIPQNVIAITLVAGGTSLPELAASLVSLLKGKNDIALGNVIGSNIANILLVLGVSSSVTPLHMNGITIVDTLVVLGGMIILFVAPFIPPKNRLGRVDAAIMLACFIIYMYTTISL